MSSMGDSSYSSEEEEFALKSPPSVQETPKSLPVEEDDEESVPHHDEPNEPEEDDVPKPEGTYIEAGALLSHVHDLESKLPPDYTNFGHPQPPQLHMCRIPSKETGLVVLIAVTKRCVSAQLVKETPDGGSTEGTAVEVLIMQGEDQITCATVLALEVPKLSAEDKLIVPDKKTQGMSLMSGGVVPVSPSPRVAVVVGTKHSRVISVEYSVKFKSLALTRRNYFAGKEVMTYFEPLPFGTLTNYQRSHQRGVPGPNGEKARRVVPFEPSDGVCTLVPYNTIRDGKVMTYVWLSFGDGTGVRLHHAAFFASVIQKHTESQPTPKSLESILGVKVVRWEARLPPLEATKFTLVPIPKYHPSPLAPFPAWKKPEIDETTGVYLDPGFEQDPRLQQENFEALVYCTGAMAESFPTLCFYTSEDQFDGRREEPDDDDEAEGASSSIITTVFGGLYGMLLGGGSSKPQEATPAPVISEKPDQWDPNVPFPSLNLDPYKLYAGCEIHDPPRQITQCTVEPEGDLAAIADTLGRVSLVDLSTKQIVRMWKGFRDTTCFWMEIPRKTKVQEGQKAKILYLVIHSRQRRVLEIWRTRHGPKVKSMQVDREAQILSVREMSRVGYIACCYLAYSNVPFTKKNQIQKIEIDEDESAGRTNLERNRAPLPVLTMVPHDAAARLNRLKQMLSDTNVECQSIDVFKALERIKSIEDLAIALDTLASSPTLERKMDVEGSSFQRLAVSYCQQKLDEAINESGREALTNPHVQYLAFKIAYYDQISKAYDVIHRHETSSDVDVHQVNVVAPSSWGLEAIGWTSVYEKITKTSIDDGIPQNPSEPLKFYEFASSLEAPKKYMDEDYHVENKGYKIYFSDSTKTRRELLVRIFKPLLGDVFSFNAVSQIFEALGTKNDNAYVMRCFGEWFASLSVKDVTKKAIFAEESPVKRWLQEGIRAYLDDLRENAEPPMQAIYEYCRRSDELVRAFWLATLCHEAISQVAEQKEEETYGTISKAALVGRWSGLLRQIRVCLLVSLRLYGIQLGPLPLTVYDVDKAEEFSPFQWLAYDELMMSHKHEEIVSLENACRHSSHSFNASTPEADSPAHWKTLQNSCLASTLSPDERTEYLVDFDDDDQMGALLLYLRRHNVGKVLVAHRALLLAAKWGKQPDDLDILEDAIVALKAIDPEELKRVAFAVRLEIWQSRIRPVYRALMFGFDDVQEVSPEVVAPLFHHVDWVKRFSEITTTVLGMLNQFEWHEAEILNLREEYLEVTDSSDVESWPAVVECPILNKLIDKNKKLKVSAFEAHQMLMAALKVTQDFAKLARCIPSFYDLFTPGALFKKAIPLEDAEENQQALMQDAVVEYARNYSGPSMDTLHLADIEVLSDLFEFEMENIRTLFLLAMYEFGKDRLVDEIITRSGPAISVVHFCAGGVEIICRRLHHLIHVNPSNDMKALMGTLDANMCEWVKEKAENSESLIGQTNMTVPVGNTHLFALRLLSLGASADIDKKERIKIHSLIVLSGSIVKGLESLHPEYRSVRESSMNIPPTPDRSRQSEESQASSRDPNLLNEVSPSSPQLGRSDRTAGETSRMKDANGNGSPPNLTGAADSEPYRDYYAYEGSDERLRYEYEPTQEANGYGDESDSNGYESPEEENRYDSNPYGYEPTEEPHRHQSNPYGYEPTEEPNRHQSNPYGYEPTEEPNRHQSNPYGYESTEEPRRNQENPYGYESTEEENPYGYESTEEPNPYGYESTEEPNRHQSNPYGYESTEDANKYGYEPTSPNPYTQNQYEENYDSGDSSGQSGYDATEQQSSDNYYDYGRPQEQMRHTTQYGNVYQDEESDSSHYTMEDESIQSSS